MVVLTTDHGTMLGEHRYWMKNLMPVYNEIAHIPLIVHVPGDRRAGDRIAALTQTTDLMPTFLDFFGAPVSIVVNFYFFQRFKPPANSRVDIFRGSWCNQNHKSPSASPLRADR